MNAERLLAYAEQLLAELTKYPLLPVLNELAVALKAGGHVAPLLKKAEELCRAAPSNSWAPSARGALKSIGGEQLVGNGALERLRATVGGGLPRKVVAAFVAEFHGEILAFEGNLNNFVNTSRALKLVPAVLPEGQWEVGVIYPRHVVGDLDLFKKALGDLDKHFRTFSELTGDAGSPPLRQVASSDPTVYLAVTVASARAFAWVIDKVLNWRRQWLELQVLEIEVKEKSSAAAAALAQDAKQLEASTVAAISTGLLEFAVVDEEGRMNELRLAASQGVSFVAQLIDQGVVLEVTAPPLRGKTGEANAEELGEVQTEARRFAESAGVAMRLMVQQREMLQLPAKSVAARASDDWALDPLSESPAPYEPDDEPSEGNG